MAIQVNSKQCQGHIATAIRAGLVPFVKGSPGIGKSAIVRAIAEEYRLKLIDLRLAQCDPTDLNGFPSICPKSGRARYAPMDTFPLEGDPIPKGYNGWLLFLDEFNSAPRAVQAAAYKVVLDKATGGYKLHPNVAMVCAGNMDDDGAIVEEMSTALQSRLLHLMMVSDPEIFLDYASRAGFDHRITDYLRFRPGNVNTFNPEVTDAEPTYACERTWDFTNRIIAQVEPTDPDALPLLAGTVSEGVAREFIGHTKIYDKLPSLAQMRSSPETIKVPDEPSILYALTGAIAHNASGDSVGDLMKFVNRLPVEFQVICLREMGRRQRELLHSQPVKDWIATNNTELF